MSLYDRRRWTLSHDAEAEDDRPQAFRVSGPEIAFGSVEVLPVAHYEAMIAEERKMADALSVDLSRFGRALVQARNAMVHRPIDSELFRSAIEEVVRLIGNGEGEDDDV